MSDRGATIGYPLFEVSFLGGFEVSCDGFVLKRLPRRATSVLAYLILNRSRVHTRDLLAGRFWSEMSDDKARRQLSNVIWQIRKAVAESGLPDLVVAERGHVGIDQSLEMLVDAEIYEAELDAVIAELAEGPQPLHINRLAKEVKAYTGDFLSGYYDDWMAAERRRLRARQSDALSRLTSLHRGASDYQRALVCAEELVELDSLREESHQEVMRLHGILGNAAAAERQYEYCQRMLDRELGAPPSEQTTMLLETIRGDLHSASPRHRSDAQADRPRMVGRVRARADLNRLLDELSVGRGGFALIEGDPGIGKSRLVEDMLERADFLGLRTLSAAHSTISGGHPYHAFREMLTPTLVGLRADHVAEAVESVWLRQVCDLFPGLLPYVADTAPNSPLHPDEETARTSEALAQVLLTQGTAKPTLMVFEDIHWADSDSMQVFAAVAGRLASSGILLALTYRRFEAQQSAAVWSTITDLESSGVSTVVQLGPLSTTEAQEMIASYDTESVWADDRDRDQVVAGAGGNPLYLLEALRDPAILDSNWPGETPVDPNRAEFPLALRVAIEDRLTELTAEGRRVLTALAVLAERSAGALVRHVAGLSRVETLTALEVLVELKFVAESELGEFRFRHDQTRRVVLALLDDGDVADTHQRAFDALAEVGEPQADRLAYHARLGAMWQQAHHWYTVAAEQAVELNSFAVAAEHFRFAYEAGVNADLEPVDRLDELLEFERVLDVIGHRGEQENLLKRLDDVDLSVEQRLQVRERRAWLLLHTNELADARRKTEAWVDWAEQNGLSCHDLLMVLGEARYRAGDAAGACESLRQALDSAHSMGARSSTVSAASLLARVLIDTSEVAEAEDLLADALDVAIEVNNVRSQIDILSTRMIAASSIGEHELAVGYLEQAVERSRWIGYRAGEVRNLVNLGSFHTVHGHAGRALTLFDEAAEVATSLGDDRVDAFIRLNLAELKHRLLGEDAEAADLARSAARYFKSVGDHRRETVAMCKLCRIDWRAGRRRLARTRINYLIENSATQDEAFAEVEARRIAAEFAVESEDYTSAAAQLDVALEKCSRDAVVRIRPAILAHRALIASIVGDDQLALEMATEASPTVESDSEFAFVTAWQCASALARIGYQGKAVRQYQVAYELLEANLGGLSEDQLGQAWRIPEFASIAESYERVARRTQMVWLPAVAAPLGRPLEDSEFVPVTVTLSSPEDWKLSSAAQRRRRRILRICREAEAVGAVARVADLASLLNMSERTTKRDLKQLREQGESPRTRRSV